MELKVVEATKVEPGDTVLLVPPMYLSQDRLAMLQANCTKLKIKALVLPPGTKICVKPEAGAPLEYQPVKWRPDGSPYGDASDEQLLAVLDDARARITKRNGWG